MLAEIRLQNFRCFDDHVVPIRPCTVVVGKNNAGKSTLVDGLRLISIASSRYLTLAIHKPPGWANIPLREFGVSPSIDGMEFNTENLFHRYGSPPAIVTAKFTSGTTLRIHIGPEGGIHAVLFDQLGKVIKTRAQAREGMLPRVEIMPQVAPVERSEMVLRPDYVRRNLSSTLASRHLRNQMNLLYEHFSKFQKLAEDTWPGLQIRELRGKGFASGSPLALLLRNDDYVAEIATMGHGLQMWIQTMWFLSRIDNQATVILDEPDVYMHPDLQRRLIRYLRQQKRQLVVTTHSAEIMSEVDPEDILVLDRQHSTSSFAASFPAAQRVLDRVGSAHNLQLARLWHTRRSLLVEGNDFRILSDIFNVLFPNEQDGLSAIPNMSIGGWTGWPYAIGSSMLLRNSGGESITVYCILDSDYHTDDQISHRYNQAKTWGVNLHIWSRKEIENYLISPSAISRIISERTREGTTPPNYNETKHQIDTAIDILKEEAFDSISNEIYLDKRSLGHSGANKLARSILDSKWSNYETRLNLVSGKSILNHIARWSQDIFGVSLNPSLIARNLRQDEVPLELQEVLKTIWQGKDCSSLRQTHTISQFMIQ